MEEYEELGTTATLAERTVVANKKRERLKEVEKSIKFHKRRIDKKTIVFAKKEDRLDLYMKKDSIL